jgi:deoxyribodipyrimidine photo-lyase
MPPEMQEAAGCRIGREYPMPIVDHLQAYRAAKQRMYAARKTARISGESDRVFQRHGSRRRQGMRARARTRA